MIGGDENRNREEVSGGEIRHKESRKSANESGEGAEFQQHVLVEYPAAKRLHRHLQDIPAGAEDRCQRQPHHWPLEPRLMVPKQHGDHEQSGCRCESGSDKQLPLLPPEFGFFLLKCPHFLRVADGVTQLAQCVFQFGFRNPLRIVLNQHLFVSETHIDITDGVDPTVCLSDALRAEAKRGSQELRSVFVI